MNSSLKTILWRTSIAVAIIAIIVSFFYAEENSRGLAAWQKVVHEAAARGESLDWKDYIPPPVPDAQNFFKAPMMAEWFVRATNTSAADAFRTLLENPENTTNVITEISASNYLAWCATLEPQFNQIRDALKRPAARIDANYTDPFDTPAPKFTSYSPVSQVLAHRAKCHLKLGEPDKALDDLTQLHRLNMTLVKNGKAVIPISTLVHSVLAARYIDAVACGLDSHSWHEPQLSAMQKQLAEIDLLDVAVGSLRYYECAWQCRILDAIPMKKKKNGNPIPQSGSDFRWWLMPRGWIDQNKAAAANLDEQIIECFSPTNHTVSPYNSKIVAADRARVFRHLTPWNYLAAVTTPSFNEQALYFARQQTWVDQAQIACGLERYRLTNGKYPSTLTDLIPQYLEKIPNDVITGTPMKYVLKNDRTFLLYSVGWNESDEGGITVRDRDGNEDRENGDWVWYYPE